MLQFSTLKKVYFLKQRVVTLFQRDELNAKLSFKTIVESFGKLRDFSVIHCVFSFTLYFLIFECLT